MKKLVILLLAIALLPLTATSQIKKKLKYKGINVAATINHYPKLEPYSFVEEYYTEREKLNLNFLTANSGTFIIEGTDSALVNRAHNISMPSTLFNIGASIQIISYNRAFHEISLTKLSFAKSENIIRYHFLDTLGKDNFFFDGYEERSGAVGLRYEVGKYFGKRKSAAVRFGLSGAFETSYYFYKRLPNTTQEYPLEAKLWTFEVALVPMLTAKLSKILFLDFKLIPNMLVADYGGVNELTPILPSGTRAGTRNYSLPEIDLAFSLLLRCQIKKAKRKKRGR